MTPVDPQKVIDQLQLIVNSVVTVSNMMHAAMAPEVKPPVDPIAPLPPEPVPPADTINGHSLAADADGFATVPSWPRLFASTIFQYERENQTTVSPARRAEIFAKLPTRLRTRSVRDNCVFPTREAWMCCNADLGARKAADPGSGLGGDPFSHDAFLWTVTAKTNPPELDWNIAPETQATVQYDYRRGDLLTAATGRAAWSSNYNPAQDVAYFNDLYVKKILAELAPRDPIDG